MKILKKFYDFATPIMWVFVLALVIYHTLGFIMQTDTPIAIMIPTNSSSGFNRGDLLFLKNINRCNELTINREDVYFNLPKIGYISLLFKNE